MVSFAIAIPHVAPPLDPTAPLSAWSTAASLALKWDVISRRDATEPTQVHIATDGSYIYVRFDATQREPIAASARSNDVGQGNDDAVWVDLWPQGNSGFYYQFQVTPNGTHFESSSENAAFQPVWQSHGSSSAGGYTATMAIPLRAMHGVHAGVWRAQFVRYIHATGEEEVWSYDVAQTLPDDVVRAGSITLDLQQVAAAARPRPRAAIYAFGETAPRDSGGSTSRTGADISLPITATSSVFATFHPDFSNVELDQQSISPSVFQRFYSEVRPFFTQASSFYNQQQYYVSNYPIQSLYTPAIPTPREGYALEGKQGEFSYAGFDAVGVARSDSAETLDFSTPDTRFRVLAQRVAVDIPQLTDASTDVTLTYQSLVHWRGALTYGTDSGTNVTSGNAAQWYDADAGWASKTFGLYGALRKIGAYFNPVDGYVSHPDIAGYGIYAAKIFDFSPSSKILSMGIQGQVDRFAGRQYGSSQSDNQLLFDVLTKSAWDFQVLSGSDYWRFGQALEPISQSAGFALTYHSGLVTNNPNNFPFHGLAATPTSLSYTTGRYGAGRLDTWLRSSTMRLGVRGSVTLTLNDTAQWMRTSADNVQWFEAASYTNQLNADSSVSIGLRRVVGQAPEPNGGGNCSGTCSNVSLAYHYRMPRSEVYLSYGDPNTLSTIPSVLFKLIFYAGAGKGV